MSIITLTEAKQHLRVTHSSEDTLIQAYLDASELQASNYINRTIYASDVGTDTNGIVMNAALMAAILLFVGHLFNNREAVTMERLNMPMELPIGVKWLLDPYRIELGV